MVTPRGPLMPLGQVTRRSPGFLALVVCAMGALFILLSGCGTPGTSKNAGTSPVAQTLPTRQVQAHVTPVPPISTAMRDAEKKLYLFSASNAGLMLPAVDAQGNVWAGEMNANRLGRLDPRTGAVSSWIPPGAQHGIMATVIDTQGNIWFAEQNANYIGRFDPRLQDFRLFSLGTWNGSPLGPQDLRFDSSGFLWFTAEAGGLIGRLNPATGAIRIWPIPAIIPGIRSYPSTLAITPGGQVWFGEMAGGAIGSIDPTTHQVTLYHLPNPQTEVFSMAVDSAGRLWFTEMFPGKLGMLDPATGDLTELPVPAIAGGPPTLYALALDHQGHIWFVDAGSNTLVRYVPEKHSMTFFQLSLPSTTPYGLTLDPAGNLWFTAGGMSANYIGKMSP